VETLAAIIAFSVIMLIVGLAWDTIRRFDKDR